ncbi:G-protein alpha subunit-domain-containing protein [Aspergillus spectabilis]
MDLDDSINCCKVLLTKLQELVCSLHQNQNSALNFQSKVKLVSGKKSIDDIQNLLEHQTNALNLLLTACNWFVILSMKAILTALNIGGIKFQSDINTDHSAFLLQYADDMIPTKPPDVRVGEAVRSLWHDRCMERVRQSPQNFGMTDSTLYLLDELDRIFSREYKPTSKDKETMQYRTPAIMELYVRYKVHQDSLEEGERKGVIDGFQFRDVTLCFGSNRPYSFEAITTIFLPVNLASYDNVLAKEPLQTELLHCTSKLKTTLQSAWFPKDKRTAILLTRPDDFDTELAAHPFADYYPGYMGVNEPDIFIAAVSCELHNLCLEPFVSAVLSSGERSLKESHLGSLIAISEFLLRLHMDGLAWLKSQCEGT